MTNRMLFRSRPTSDPYVGQTTRNAAGGKAFKMNPEHALAQYAFTGTLSNTFYTKAELHLEKVLALCNECDPEFVAKTAVAARQQGYMKDMPAMLAAYLHTFHPQLLARVFDRVLDNGKMVKNFVQIVRSGRLGRRGLGSTTKNLLRAWLEGREDVQLMYDNIGGNKSGDVSLADILRLVRPNPQSKERSALYAWIRGAKVVDGERLVQSVRYKDRKSGEFVETDRVYSIDDLPKRVQAWEAYKVDPHRFEKPPKVPFQMLTSLELGVDEWEVIAKNMSWQELRQNLNTLQRHGVLDNPRILEYVCEKLRNPEEIAKAKCFPYQLLVAYLNTGPTPQGFGWTTNYWQSWERSDDGKGKEADKITAPKVARYALEAALEEAVKNVPAIEGQVFVCPDTSGSMGYPVTGERGHYGQPPKTKVRCVDVAGLITAAILRHNPTARALPFSTRVHDIELNPMDSVMRNAEKFTALGGGGTNCSEPLRVLNSLDAIGDVVVFVSDYESWADTRSGPGTAMMKEWSYFKVRNPKAKLVCVDLTPRDNKQLTSHPDILHVGGFSDQVFKIMARFVKGELAAHHWTDEIQRIEV